MGDAKVRFAEGEIGKLFSFTGKDVPPGTTPLTEEDGTSLTEAGKTYCQKRKLNPHVESIRVQYGQQTSYAVLQAAEASIKNQETRLERDAKAKGVSEKLRLDWAQQDKAYQEALKTRS